MRKYIFPFLAVAGLALLTGMWAGLVRLGWAIPAWRAALHGPLMISGFLGVLISLERAVAFRRRWAYAAPAAAAIGALGLLIGLPVVISQGLFVGGSAILLAAFVITYYQHYREQVEWASLTLILGVGLWLAGNSLWWMGRPLNQVTPWWIGFLIVTIAGERLELARILLLNRIARLTFGLSISLLVGGLLLSLFAFSLGLQIIGAGLIAIGAWLLYFDIARRTIRQTGLTRFIAACLLPGYSWLTFAGLLWIGWPAYFAGGPFYDAMLHTILLGFVFSMIFGHAPIIIPAILGTGIVYRPFFYAHLILLHLSLVMRVVGDLGNMPSLRLWSGMLNVAAILLFIGNTILAVRTALLKSAP